MRLIDSVYAYVCVHVTHMNKSCHTNNEACLAYSLVYIYMYIHVCACGGMEALDTLWGGFG